MQLSAKEAWKRILDEAHRELPDQTIRTWLEPDGADRAREGRLIVGAPDQFAVEWNETKHALAPGAAGRAGLLGQPTSIVFRVHEDRQKRPQMDFFVAPPARRRRATGESAASANPSTQPLNERYTFDTFVIGKSNELAAAAAHAVAEAPGKTYNPLFIYGATGLGKTHLMQAIAHAGAQAAARAPGCSTSAPSSSPTRSSRASTAGRCPSSGAATAATWTSSWWTTCISSKARKRPRRSSSTPSTPSTRRGKQIVLTSDRPPKEIPGLEERLVSRFEWGMVADIGQPDLEHRIAILRKKAGAGPPRADDPGRRARASSPSTCGPTSASSRAASSSCCSSPRSSTARSRSSWPARRSPTRSVPGDGGSRRRHGRCRRIDKVQEVVARRWGVTPEGLRSKARTKTLTVPRQIAMYLAREMLGMQLVEIGQAFGGRDHSTVIHSVDKVEPADDSAIAASASGWSTRARSCCAD